MGGAHHDMDLKAAVHVKQKMEIIIGYTADGRPIYRAAPGHHRTIVLPAPIRKSLKS
jgi:hypothetical protein